MMMSHLTTRALLVATVLAVLPASVARAQNRVLIGPAVGYEFSVPLFLQRVPGAINHEPTFEGRGTSASHTIQLGVHALMPDAFSFGALSGRVLLGVTSGWFESEPFIPGDTGQLRVVGEPRRFEVDGLAGTVQLDAHVRARLGGSYSVGIGVWSLYRFAERYTRSEYLESPILLEFSSPEVVTDESIGGYPISIGPSASIATTVEVAPGATLMAEVGTRLDLVGLRRGLGASALTFSPALSLLLGPTRGETIIIQAEPLAVSTTSSGSGPVASRSGDTTAFGREAVPGPSARIDIFGVGSSGVMQSVPIAATDVVRRVFATPPRVVPFAAGSVTPLPGVAVLTAAEAANFRPTSLTGQDALTHARHGLNLLGMRLRASPSATVLLSGGHVPGERAGIGAERAEWVRRYLVDVWGIEAERIRDGRDVISSAVVVIDGPADLFMPPVATQWRQRSGMLPEIGLERTVDAPGGLARWEVEVSHGGIRLAHVSSDDESGTADLRFVGERRPDDALLARLTVEDSLGRRVTAEDRLPLTRAEAPGARIGRREVVDVLIPVAANGELDTAAVTLLAVVRRALRDGARVSVAPLGTHPAWAAGAAAIRAAQVGRAVLELAAANGTALDRLTIERRNLDRSVAPAILVTVESGLLQDDGNEP